MSEPSWRRVPIRRTFGLLMIPIAFLTIASLTMWQLRRMSPDSRWSVVLLSDLFNLDREVNLPTWFSAALWLASGALAVVIGSRSTSARRSWLFFAALCVLFSIDESTSLHERLNPVGGELARQLQIDLRYGWVLPGIVIAIALALGLFRFVLTLPAAPRSGILGAGTLFVLGAVGGEVLSDLAARGTPIAEFPNSPGYIAFNTFEEVLEMAGVALCFASLLNLVSWRHDVKGTSWKVDSLSRSGGEKAELTNGRKIKG